MCELKIIGPDSNLVYLFEVLCFYLLYISQFQNFKIYKITYTGKSWCNIAYT